MSKIYEFVRPTEGAQVGEQVAGNDFSKKKLGKAADLLKDGVVRIVSDDATPDAPDDPPVEHPVDPVPVT